MKDIVAFCGGISAIIFVLVGVIVLGMWGCPAV